MSQHFLIKWFDHVREPQYDSDPRYPDGIDIRVSSDEDLKTCRVELPYPALRCGLYMIECTLCGFTFGASTAGRRDDPRSVTIPCKLR